MPSATEIYQELVKSTPEVEKTADAPSEIVKMMLGNDDLRNQVLGKLAEAVKPETTEDPVKTASDEELVKTAQEYEAAGRFMAQGFIAGVEEHEGLDKHASAILDVLEKKADSGEELTEEEKAIAQYLLDIGEGE